MSEPRNGTYIIVDLTRTAQSDTLVFWRASRYGYTANVADAGTYTEDDARGICFVRDSDNVAIPSAVFADVESVRAVPKSALVDVLTHALMESRVRENESEDETREIDRQVGGLWEK